MRVLHLTSVYDTPVVRQQIQSLRSKGIECDVVSATSLSVDAEPDSFISKFDKTLFSHNLVYYGICALQTYPRILNKLSRNDYDLIHVTSGVVAPLALLQPKRPIVLTLKGSDLLGNRFYGQQSRITRKCAERCDATIVMSDEMKNELDGNAVVIPPGIDLEKFKPMDRQQARQSLGWDQQNRHVLFPYDTNREEKRYSLASQIVEQVQSHADYDITLHAVTGEPHSKIPIYMNASDALLLTSTHEGSPTTVKEALACNTPVLSTDVGDVRKRLDNVTPSFVSDSPDVLIDGLIDILEGEGRCNGRKQVRNLGINEISDKILDVYEQNL